MRKSAEIVTSFAPRSALDGLKSFYLVGIGGAGMSGVAMLLHKRGFAVQGSDATASPVTRSLSELGIPVAEGGKVGSLTGVDGLILSDAIDLDTQPEVLEARRLGLPIFRRSQALGWLLKGYRVIAVTGTHGKTTTTGMIGSAFLAAGESPLIVVGAEIPEWNAAVVDGPGPWAVVEACEAYDGLHDIDPEIVVLTNLEADHLDFHGSLAGLQASMGRFVDSAQTLLYASDDPGAKAVADAASVVKSSYGPMEFEAESGRGLRLPGKHNATNASGALRAALAAGVPKEHAVSGIGDFGGADRRLQVLRTGDITVIDDYAHHPTEIAATLQAVRSKWAGRLIAVFQPHLYSRTRDLIPEFAAALSLADWVVITDIYPARERPIPGVSASRIAEAITKPSTYVPSRHVLPQTVARIVRPGDVVVAMGAGNIAEFGPAFVDLLGRQSDPLRRTSVAVLYGGDSAEREVSNISGPGVAKALESKGYDVRLLDATELLLGKGDLSALTGPNRPDAVMLAVHGTHAEDGAIQGLCELLHLPYTGSGIQASALAMDKQRTKQILQASGLPVPRGVLLTSPDQPLELTAPLVVKPNAQGSTVGLTFVETQDQLAAAIEFAFGYDSAVLVEEWIRGIEVSAPILGDRQLPVVEIVPNNGRYDFASKYLEGATNEIIPARISPEQTRRVQDYALRAHQALGCSGATRTDMLIREDEIFILEVNTLPGMTATSLLPNSAQAIGMSYADLVDWIVQDALVRHGAQT